MIWHGNKDPQGSYEVFSEDRCRRRQGARKKPHARRAIGMGQAGRAPERQREENQRRRQIEMIYKRMGHWHLDVTIHGVRYREARWTQPTGARRRCWKRSGCQKFSKARRRRKAAGSLAESPSAMRQRRTRSNAGGAWQTGPCV